MFNNQVIILSSGNIFFENDKIFMMHELFGSCLGFRLCRVFFDSDIDCKVLNYSNDYINNQNFKSASNVRVDFGLTKNLGTNIEDNIERFLEKNENVSQVRFKLLGPGGKIYSEQVEWLKENNLSKNEISKLCESFDRRFKCNELHSYKVCNAEVSFELTGIYRKWAMISGGELLDVTGRSLNINDTLPEIRSMPV